MKKNSLNLIIPALLICVLSIITLISTQEVVSISEIVAKQIIFVITGVAIFFIFSKFDFSVLKFKPVIIGIYLFTILILLATLIFGEVVNGSRRWISLLGVQIQPSEIAKLAIIFITAYIFTLTEKYKEWVLLIASFLIILPILLLIYLEPHGSMTIICMAIWAITAFTSMRHQWKIILILTIATLSFFGIFLAITLSKPIFYLIFVAGIIIATFSFFAKNSWKAAIIVTFILSIFVGVLGSIAWKSILNDYQKQRIEAFINPDANSQTSAFNVIQSQIAIGSGGIWGRGFANGTQSRLNFLPFHQTDFIFASFAEQYGLIGSLILFTLYTYIFIIIFKTPLKYPEERFQMTIVVAIGIKILAEFFINIGTNLGIIPATGIPLPLMSAGGTITIMTFFSLAVIQSIIGLNNEKYLR